MGASSINPNYAMGGSGGAGMAGGSGGMIYGQHVDYTPQIKRSVNPAYHSMWDKLHNEILGKMERVKIYKQQANYSWNAQQYSNVQMTGQYTPQQVNQMWNTPTPNISAGQIAPGHSYQTSLGSIAVNQAQANVANMTGGLTTTAPNPTVGSVKRAMNAVNRIIGSSSS